MPRARGEVKKEEERNRERERGSDVKERRLECLICQPTFEPTFTFKERGKNSNQSQFFFSSPLAVMRSKGGVCGAERAHGSVRACVRACCPRAVLVAGAGTE